MRLALPIVFLFALAAPPAAATSPATPGVHRTFLPQASEVGERHLAAGALPDAAHPRGTVLLGWSLDSVGPAITEWDLANEKVVRQTALGWPHAAPEMVRTPVSVDVLGGEGRVRYARLDAATLRVRCQVDLGSGGALSLASDGALTAVAWDAPRGSETDLHVVTLDGACARQGEMTVPSWKSGIGLAVMAGHVYGLALARPRPWLMSIAPNATVERGIPLDVPAPPTMTVAGSRLLLLTTDEVLEIGTRLDVVARHKIDAPDTTRLAAASDGRMLLTSGDVLSPSFARVGHFQPSQMLPMQPAWVSDVPVILATDLMPLRHVSLAWVDPGARELGPAWSPP
jgi:hypothetical protein